MLERPLIYCTGGWSRRANRKGHPQHGNIPFREHKCHHAHNEIKSGKNEYEDNNDPEHIPLLPCFMIRLNALIH